MADNLYQQANSGFTFTIYAALVSGAVAAVVSSKETSALIYIEKNIDAVLLFTFIALFNMKTYFDDHKHFGELYQRDELWERDVGISLALLSWLFMAISAALISSPRNSAIFLVIGIFVSSLWILVHLIELKRAKGRPQSQKVIRGLRNNWFFMNVVYFMILILYISLPNINGVDVKVIYMLAITLFLIYDMATSEMTKGVLPKRSKKDKDSEKI